MNIINKETLHKLQKKLTGPLGKTMAVFLGLLVIAAGSKTLFNDAITVSNTVNGRELPIYCVETPEKKVALSFDAAWGNDRY